MTRHDSVEAFLDLFNYGDVTAAIVVLQGEPALSQQDGYEAHSLLREFVKRTGGHCYSPHHLAIADLRQ